MVTAEFDLSRSETEEYCRLLREAGNEVSIKCYRGMPHAFGHYNHPERGLKQSHLYMDETADMIRRAHEM
jgi:acetyl esterase/lipase